MSSTRKHTHMPKANALIEHSKLRWMLNVLLLLTTGEMQALRSASGCCLLQ